MNQIAVSENISDEGPDAFAEALGRLARGADRDLAGLLHAVEVDAVVDGTRVVAHCHVLKVDRHGRPRVRDLVRCICDNVLDFAISRSRISEARDHFVATGSSSKVIRLAGEARRLFTDLEKSGEGGELLLFVMAERILRLPQLLCKMSLKTNARMHVHGADGLHAEVDESSGHLVLYWGESKIYGDATAAITDCMKSIAPMLLEDGNEGAASDRDLQLLQMHADLDDPALEAKLRVLLDVDSEEYNSIEFRGLCLVGFDCDAYAVDASSGDSTVQVEAISAKVAQLLPGWKKHVGKRIKTERLESFGMHVICVPFPSVEDFRARMRTELGISGDVEGPVDSSIEKSCGVESGDVLKANGQRKGGGKS